MNFQYSWQGHFFIFGVFTIFLELTIRNSAATIRLCFLIEIVRLILINSNFFWYISRNIKLHVRNKLDKLEMDNFLKYENVIKKISRNIISSNRLPLEIRTLFKIASDFSLKSKRFNLYLQITSFRENVSRLRPRANR